LDEGNGQKKDSTYPELLVCGIGDKEHLVDDHKTLVEGYEEECSVEVAKSHIPWSSTLLETSRYREVDQGWLELIK